MAVVILHLVLVVLAHQDRATLVVRVAQAQRDIVLVVAVVLVRLDKLPLVLLLLVMAV